MMNQELSKKEYFEQEFDKTLYIGFDIPEDLFK